MTDSTKIKKGMIKFNHGAAQWKYLIDEILKGNVIPVIGPSILCDGGDIHQQNIQYLAEEYQISPIPSSFSELIYNHDFLGYLGVADNIYDVVNQLYEIENYEASNLLKEILSIRQFPFVITTSFTPIVENVMREIWGDELRVLRFRNDPRTNDDIEGESDLHKPTVYYMFGKVEEESHRYVLTDTDMLEFCSSWVAETGRRPENFVNRIKDKYLLMLGHNYSDWLFRFIWYSLCKENNNKNKNNNSGLYVYKEKDELFKFLQRNQIFLQGSPAEVIRKIKEMLDQRLETIAEEELKFDKVEYGADIFISYSRSDSEFVAALYNKLTEKGINAWYDKNNISYGGRFMEEINRGIQTAKYFLPILTQHIEDERKESHVYRKEWKVAGQYADTLGRTYIIPVFEQGFDFYNAQIPEQIQQCNAMSFDKIDKANLDELVRKIIQTINQETL